MGQDGKSSSGKNSIIPESDSHTKPSAYFQARMVSMYLILEPLTLNIRRLG
jgi:hypothetical protein